MKLILAFVTFLLLSGFSPRAASFHTIAAEKEVYFCVSKTETVYHSTKDCRGLSHCTHEINKVSLKAATDEYGRRACKECY